MDGRGHRRVYIVGQRRMDQDIVKCVSWIDDKARTCRGRIVVNRGRVVVNHGRQSWSRRGQSWSRRRLIVVENQTHRKRGVDWWSRSCP